MPKIDRRYYRLGKDGAGERKIAASFFGEVKNLMNLFGIMFSFMAHEHTRAHMHPHKRSGAWKRWIIAVD